MTVLDPRRAGRITGSRVSAILGLNPYKKRAEVLREMVREAVGAPSEFNGNVATRYGTDMEPQALAQYEAQQGVMTYGGDTLHIHPEHDFLAVTPDGFVGDDGLIECKAPYRGSYTHHADVPYYLPQMHLQMACTGRQWCDFAVLQRDGTLHVSRLDYDPGWLAEHLPALEAFMADYRAALEDPAPHTGEAVRTDDAWRDAAEAYRLAKSAADEAAAQLDAAKARMVELAGECSAKGWGLHVIRSEREGSIAYARAVKDHMPNIDLSAYRGKPSISYTIKEAA